MARTKKGNANAGLRGTQRAAQEMLGNIRRLSAGRELQAILFTSSVAGEGKSHTAWHLAEAAADAGLRVLLVECDMHNRSLADTVGLKPEKGLVAVLQGTAKVKEAIIPTPVENLYFLDVEPDVPHPEEVLAGKRMDKFNEHLKNYFDYILYDTPAVNSSADATVLGRIADGAILCVRPGLVKRRELKTAGQALAKAGVEIIGICTTCEGSSGSGKRRGAGDTAKSVTQKRSGVATKRPAALPSASSSPAVADTKAESIEKKSEATVKKPEVSEKKAESIEKKPEAAERKAATTSQTPSRRELSEPRGAHTPVPGAHVRTGQTTTRKSASDVTATTAKVGAHERPRQ